MTRGIVQVLDTHRPRVRLLSNMARRAATRPSTRSLATATAREAAARVPVRDFTAGATGFTIEWDVRSVYDFLFSLSEDAGSTEDLPVEDRRWLKESRAALATLGHPHLEVLRHDVAVHTAAFAVARPWLRTVESFVDGLESEGPAPLLQAVFGEMVDAEPGFRALFDRAVRGDASAVGEMEASTEWKHKEKLGLLRDPADTHRQVVVMLRAWAERFGEIEERVGVILARDYEARAGDRLTLDPADLVETTTGGIRLLPEPGVRRVILAPSYFSRPYNFLLAGDDWRFFGYPVADSALDSSDALAPPLAVLRLHRALGDGTRLRILKLLAGGDLYLTEIAQQLELSKPTIKHHLTQLRAAGLLTIVESGSVVYYSLRRERLDDAAADIRSFLVG
jgi:DNA-binding transcriptional ArsR family regulator